MRLAIAGRRIGNPIAPEAIGFHGNQRAALLRDGATVLLEPSDGGFLLPDGGALLGDVLLFQRDTRATRAVVVDLEPELVVVETDEERAARSAAAAKAVAAAIASAKATDAAAVPAKAN